MGRKVYRFEIVRELARSGQNGIFEARDTLDDSTLLLLEWGALSSPQKPQLQQAADQIVGPEIFSFAEKGYLAAGAQDVPDALAALRAAGLFTGYWPGYIPEPAAPPPPQPPPPPSPAPEPATTPAPKKETPPVPVSSPATPGPVPPSSFPHPSAVPAVQPKRRGGGWAVMALLLLIGGIVGLIAWSNYQDNLARERRQREQERAALNLKLEEEKKQKEAAEAELKRLRDAEQARAKKEAEEKQDAEVKEAERLDTEFKASQQQIAAGQKPALSVLTLRNCTAEKMFVAIHYLALNDKWVTTGWWEIAPNATTNAGVWTNNRVLYFYSESTNRANVWNGAGQSDSVDVDVVTNRFSIIRGEAVLGRDKRRVSAFRRTLSFNDGTATQSIGCGVR